MSELAQPAITPPVVGLSLQRSLLIAVVGFLTLVDLFATQAILPSLARDYRVTPAQIGLAANASTLGMAISGLLFGAFSRTLERKRAISLCLLLLSIPTASLAFAPNLTIFAFLRVIQGFSAPLRCARHPWLPSVAPLALNPISYNALALICANLQRVNQHRTFNNSQTTSQTAPTYPQG